MSQTEAWTNEYRQLTGMPTSLNRQVSSSTKHFLQFLQSKHINSGNALDIGCGLGRNSLFLAKNGFDVWAFDIVQDAISHVEEETKRLHLPIRASVQSALDTWQYQDHFFDAAIDICVFDNMITNEMKEKYLSELFRVLKPGGYFCILAILADDGYYGPLLKQSEKKADYILHDPQNDIWSSMLPEEQLKELLCKSFTLVESYNVKKQPDLMYDKKYARSLARIIVQKAFYFSPNI